MRGPVRLDARSKRALFGFGTSCQGAALNAVQIASCFKTNSPISRGRSVPNDALYPPGEARGSSFLSDAWETGSVFSGMEDPAGRGRRRSLRRGLFLRSWRWGFRMMGRVAPGQVRWADCTLDLTGGRGGIIS